MKTGLEGKSDGELYWLKRDAEEMMDVLRASKHDIVDRMRWWKAARSLYWLVSVERDRRFLAAAVGR